VDIFRLSDDELLARTRALARVERGATYDLVEHLAEVDRRDLPTDRESMSLYDFCVHQLHLSEDAAYRRIRAARAIRKFPPISVLFKNGTLTLETISQLNPFLDDPDAAALVKSCIGLRKWQVQALLAGRKPETARRDVVRYCGPVIRTSTPTSPAPLLDAKTPTAEPVVDVQRLVEIQKPADVRATTTPPRVYPVQVHAIRVSFSADGDFHQLMRRAQALLRHKYPDGRLEGVLKDALIALLRKRDRSFGWREPSSRGKK
jgi:hypothetical protein